MLLHERKLWAAGCTTHLAGVDEAGRGCLAGPVVAGAVSIPPHLAEELYAGKLATLNDSKQLSPARRDYLYELLTNTPGILWATGWSTAQEIDSINILAATHLAMRRALDSLSPSPDHALIDGLPVKGLPCNSTAIVRGDAASFLIAAASIIAKTSRDRYMSNLHKQYPHYAFDANKGYGVNAHMAALFKHGACPEHRHSFRPVQDALQQLPGFEFYD